MLIVPVVATITHLCMSYVQAIRMFVIEGSYPRPLILKFGDILPSNIWHVAQNITSQVYDRK